MFYIDFWGFTNDPLYFGYNSAGPENPVFHVFDVSGPKRSQKRAHLRGTSLFIHENQPGHEEATILGQEGP